MTKGLGDLPPYPAYRDSGVSWLGKVPEAWDVRRAKSFMREVDERSTTGNEELLSVSHLTGVTPRRNKNVTMFLAESTAGHKICRPGDVVINTMWAWMAALGIARQLGIVSPSYGIYRPSSPGQFRSRFLDELLRTPAYRSEYVVRSTGITPSRLRLYPDQFLRIPILCPAPEEQAAIVRFLDHADQQIRRYIRAKQKLIKLLEEQKQAIIHRAVTRGLDPNVRLKPSGVAWLGEVPEHWEVRGLGRCLLRIEQGWSPVAAEGEMLPDQWAVLTLSAVRRGHFNAAAFKPIERSAEIPEGIEIADGNFLLTRSNTRERVGDVCLVKNSRPRTVMCDLIYRLTPDLAILYSEFLMYQLLGPFGRLQIESDARGSSETMPKIAQRHIRSWKVLVPPQAEQRCIVQAIEKQLGSVLAAASKAQREMDFLYEYRTRLIADVVTGKLDVREAAANLREGAAAPEELDADLTAELDGESGEDAGIDPAEPDPD